MCLEWRQGSGHYCELWHEVVLWSGRASSIAVYWLRVNCTVDEHCLHLLVLEGLGFRYTYTEEGRNRSFPRNNNTGENLGIRGFSVKLYIYFDKYQF